MQPVSTWDPLSWLLRALTPYYPATVSLSQPDQKVATRSWLQVLSVGFGSKIVIYVDYRLAIVYIDAIYSRTDRTSCGIQTARLSHGLTDPDQHGWWTLQWYERKMQRVTAWHRCTLMEVRLTSLQAHRDLKWQIAPCCERSIFGATPTPTVRVTNAAEYIHTLWNLLNYTSLWTPALSSTPIEYSQFGSFIKVSKVLNPSTHFVF